MQILANVRCSPNVGLMIKPFIGERLTFAASDVYLSAI